MKEDQTHQILNHLVSQLGKTLGDMNARIRALEDDGFAIVDIDWARQYPDKTLGRAKNGIFQYQLATGTWRNVVNSIHSVSAVETPTGTKFVFERSTGDVFEGEIAHAKPRKKAA